MTDPDQTFARRPLDAALDDLATTFRGMTAHPDEHNCECHWGSAEELALLKTADVELDPDLLRRTWWTSDWDDYASVLRRILPQLASVLVNGQAEPLIGMVNVGRSLAHADWQHWPAEQTDAVQRFLDAWWVSSLTSPDAAVPAYEVLEACSEAFATLDPWLAIWQTLHDPLADQRLTEAVAYWEHDLLRDQLPWDTWNDEEATRTTLTAWLLRHAPERLRAHGAPEHLLHRVWLLGLTWQARWEDPFWLDPNN
ncbi:hypothetical protein [Nonomuraea lactucae]|uniref:hypothetical protein n=1 Tax=Nonomuraea lactucae TaxID=2249762 RepID=UPI000DE4EE70|nr:hypothetical protein [Nonomuraea lactucae]